MKPLLLALALGAAAPGVAPVFAQYPERPIRLVVPQAAGSATDGALIRRDSAKWAEVIKRSGAKID